MSWVVFRFHFIYSGFVVVISFVIMICPRTSTRNSDDDTQMQKRALRSMSNAEQHPADTKQNQIEKRLKNQNWYTQVTLEFLQFGWLFLPFLILVFVFIHILNYLKWRPLKWRFFLVWICIFPTIGLTQPIETQYRNRFMTLLIIMLHISHLPFALSSSVLLHFMVCFVLSLMLLDYVVVDRNCAFSESLPKTLQFTEEKKNLNLSSHGRESRHIFRLFLTWNVWSMDGIERFDVEFLLANTYFTTSDLVSLAIESVFMGIIKTEVHKINKVSLERHR